MSQTASIHMGHGQMVDIVALAGDKWDIVFSEAGVENYKAPPLVEVEADAIDQAGRIHPLKISAGDSVSSVRASGHVAGAYRVRMRVLHGDHFHTRESLLPGASAIAPKAGARGGAQAELGDGKTIEIKSLSPTHWELLFSSGGVVATPPAAGEVVVQAIGPRAEDYQIRNLTTSAASDGKSLIASGKIKDATHARVTIKSNGAELIRSFPIIPAA
ncbi:hypothetical protein [Terrarubrum flagellatum]|uniref:hypothetical protein n=1 Tax=Terrirubrum flagellatum TaxID=2895980 RepID=UPI0031456491